MRTAAPRTFRRRLLALTVASAAVLAVAACGSDDSDAAGSVGDTRTVDHARGKTDVPTTPARVVVLEPVQLDTAIALQITPVGAAVLNEAAGVPKYLGDKAAGITTVGTVQEPNVQKIAALKPDLIIGTESRHSALYQQLTDVAPTVFMATQTDPWQDNVRFTATTLGGADSADKLLTGFQQRCADIAKKFGTAGKSAQLIRPRDGVLTLYGPTSFAGSALECVGFTTPQRDWENSISVDISPERVLEAKADHVFVTTVDVNDRSTIPASVTANAAAFPRLHLVDQSFWITGVGTVGGQAVLDDLERILTASS